MYVLLNKTYQNSQLYGTYSEHPFIQIDSSSPFMKNKLKQKLKPNQKFQSIYKLTF